MINLYLAEYTNSIFLESSEIEFNKYFPEILEEKKKDVIRVSTHKKVKTCYLNNKQNVCLYRLRFTKKSM